MDAQAAPVDLELARFALRVASPSVVFLAAFSVLFTRPKSTQASSSPITAVVVKSKVPRRAALLSLLSLSALTYFLGGLSFVIFALIHQHWDKETGIEINAIIGLVAFAGLAAAGAWKDVQGVEVWFLRRLKSVVALSLGADIALVVLLGFALNDASNGPIFPIDIPSLLQFIFPAFRVLVLIPLLASLLFPRVVYTEASVAGDDDEEAQPQEYIHAPTPSTGLLGVPGFNANDQGKYGTFRSSRSILQRSNPTTRAPTPTPEQPQPKQSKNEKAEISLDPSWSELWQRFRRVGPYLWPSKSPGLISLAAICVVLLIIGRFVTPLMPFAMGELVKVLEGRSDRSIWNVLGFYVILRFLQGSGGLNALRDSLWAPVMQYSDREMSQLSFNHLLDLSFAFHTRRKTGEVLRVLDRGAAINKSLELVLFNIFPTFIDIFVALVLFCFTFEWTLTVVVFFVMFAYVAASVGLTRWRTKLRRQMNERDIVTRGIHTDCLLNYETVKYFGGEEHEAARYRSALNEYQALEYKVIISLNLLNLIQTMIITVGLLVGSIIVARRSIEQDLGASQFVIFITYLGALYAPLNQLGYVYRSINATLVDTERLLKLLDEPTEINDKPNAPDLIVEDGEIEFDNVSFSYDGRTTALHGVSFKVPKNSSVALVGESGSGKSTILRLLYRFYDLQEGQGRILIDGKDIRDVTQKSLRQAIGVVPQDSVLFNTSIKYNIGYGKLGSSDEEIEAATRSAQMHDRVLSFPQGYDTVVGERGVRLSGGEKQRVAIARTLLKNPPILLLDEATSALDTSTEKDIQKALQNLILGRSSLSIAHRLSTIASADLILVLKDGQIVEQGSHKELVARDGLFASMWADQISASGTDDGANSIGGSVKREVSGYDAAGPSESEHAPAPPTKDDMATGIPERQQAETDTLTPAPAPAASAPVAFPTSEEAEEQVIAPESEGPRAFPTSEVEGETAASPPSGSAAAPGVTFESDVGSPRSETGTATTTGDADGSRRRRKGSENFQKFARRISITSRRQGSVPSVASMIPGLGSRKDKDKESEQQQQPSGGGEGGGGGGGSSIRGSVDTPTPSVAEGESSKKKSKEKKKRRTLI